MRNFTSRQISQVFGICIRGTKPHHIIITIIVWILLINGSTQFSLLKILLGAVSGLVFMLILYAVATIVIVHSNAKVYKVLDEQGLCMEYLRVYERERILNKPFRFDYALEYAEILMNVGKPEEAIKFLDTLTISEKAHPVYRASYFFIYVVSALKLNNLAVAEEVWKRNSSLINRISKDPASVMNGYLVIISIIYIDCFAARQNGDNSRLERALKLTESAINSKIGKMHAAGGNYAFDIVRLYELKMLGMMERYNELFSAVKSKVENSKPAFSCIKTMELDDLEKIENGELPI